jgi:hypothetical protein
VTVNRARQPTALRISAVSRPVSGTQRIGEYPLGCHFHGYRAVPSGRSESLVSNNFLKRFESILVHPVAGLGQICILSCDQRETARRMNDSLQ